MLLPPNFVGYLIQILLNGSRLIRGVFEALNFLFIGPILCSGVCLYSTSYMVSTLGDGR